MLFRLFICFLLSKSALAISVKNAQDPEDRLFADLFVNYQRLARPVVPNGTVKGDPINVFIGMQFVLLINVTNWLQTLQDERNQIMQSNVWMTLMWQDAYLQWNKDHYDGIDNIRAPCEKVWLPDIVLNNNADGQYEPTFYSNVAIFNEGFVVWVPPALYKSTCIMDVEHFPFDEQHCKMYFSSWTYDESEVQLGFYNNIQAVDLSQYYYSSIWDIVDCPAVIRKNNSEVEFTVVLRRKTLFYTVVLIVPSILMALVVVIVFYLPTDAGEKIGLSILNLLSVTVFLNLLMKILPSTSSSVPLLAKFLLMIFIMNCSVIFISVMTVNVHFRSSSTHVLSNWMYQGFLVVIPRLLMMYQAERGKAAKSKISKSDVHVCSMTCAAAEGIDHPPCPHLSRIPRPELTAFTYSHHPHCRFSRVTELHPNHLSSNSNRLTPQSNHRTTPAPLLTIRAPTRDHLSAVIAKALPAGAQCALDCLETISKHVRDGQEGQQVTDDWKFIALVIDRLFLLTFTGITIGGTFGLFLSVPHLGLSTMTQRDQIVRLGKLYNWYGFRHMGDQLDFYTSPT